jgi:hypothetical protein
MGYHNGSDIPNYWSYARHFVLQDHMFASNLGWSSVATAGKGSLRNRYVSVKVLQIWHLLPM